MRKNVILIFLLIILNSVIAYHPAHGPSSISGGVFELNKTIKIKIEHPENVDYIVVKVPLLYEGEAQSVNLTIDRDYKVENGFYIIRIDNPKHIENITLHAIIEVDYDGWKIKQPTFIEEYENLSIIKEGELTKPSAKIRKKANSFLSEDVYLTTTKIVDWVYDNVEYDLSYTDKKLSASEVYNLRKGTCDEFSHLVIAMFQSIGIPTRFVKGYVFSNNTWEPHAWVEYYNPHYEWLPIDPTFDEYVYLSGQRIGIAYGDEQNDNLSDSVSAFGHGDFNVSFESVVTINTIKVNYRNIRFLISHEVINTNSSNQNQKGETKAITVKVTLENMDDKYYFIPTTFVLPSEIGGFEKNIIILAPYETKVITKTINVSKLGNGGYRIPYHLNLFGYEYSGNFEIINGKLNQKNSESEKRIIEEMSQYWWLMLIPFLLISIKFILPVSPAKHK